MVSSFFTCAKVSDVIRTPLRNRGKNFFGRHTIRFEPFTKPDTGIMHKFINSIAVAVQADGNLLDRQPLQRPLNRKPLLVTQSFIDQSLQQLKNSDTFFGVARDMNRQISYIDPEPFTSRSRIQRHIAIIVATKLTNSDPHGDRSRPGCESALLSKGIERIENLQNGLLSNIFNIDMPAIAMSQRTGQRANKVTSQFANGHITINSPRPQSENPVLAISFPRFVHFLPRPISQLSSRTGKSRLIESVDRLQPKVNGGLSTRYKLHQSGFLKAFWPQQKTRQSTILKTSALQMTSPRRCILPLISLRMTKWPRSALDQGKSDATNRRSASAISGTVDRYVRESGRESKIGDQIEYKSGVFSGHVRDRWNLVDLTNLAADIPEFLLPQDEPT